MVGEDFSLHSILRMHHKSDNFSPALSRPPRCAPYHYNSLLMDIPTFLSPKSIVHRAARVMLLKHNVDHVIP